MLVKFLARGTGSARDAADYLLGERDAAGKPREGVEVLRGDLHQVVAVANTLPFEHKYTSGVIAWAPEDEPTDEQIGAVLDAFEETAWAGLDFDRYAWSAVLHRELLRRWPATSRPWRSGYALVGEARPFSEGSLVRLTRRRCWRQAPRPASNSWIDTPSCGQ